MPLPLLGIGVAIAAGTVGAGNGIHGIARMKNASKVYKAAEEQHKNNLDRLDARSMETNNTMDILGKRELSILNSFEDFSDLMEKIQNRPEFMAYSKEGVTLPRYDREELTNVSIGAGVLLGGLGGAAAGTAGGFAAAGATTSAIMAFGTASTGTAIASLSGAAATNATLAALGGGAIAAGGGGIALGTTVLSAATLGVGLLVGGMIFNITGKKISNNAEEADNQMEEAEVEINKICEYLEDLSKTASKYIDILEVVKDKYEKYFNKISFIINNKTDWNDFSEQEKLTVQNTVLLVGLLYNMCKVNLVKKARNDNDMNEINCVAINKSVRNAKKILNKIA